MTPSDSSGSDGREAPARGRTNRRMRLGAQDLAEIDDVLAPADDRMTRLYPGDDGSRQPVHTVYVPADRVTVDLPSRWGAAARKALDDHAPTAADLERVLGRLEADVTSPPLADVWERMLAKLDSEPVEDLRIDFEDGYQPRDDVDEDYDALAAAAALRAIVTGPAAPAFCGIRFSSMEAATRRRGLRTLDLFLGALLDSGDLPDGWVVTLPKVTSLEQVEAMVEACARLEAAYGLPAGRLRFEVQVETAQAILAYDGTVLVARLVHAGHGRISGLHFGTYDYTAALGIPADFQSMDHPAAVFAKNLMAIAAAQTGVRVCDGSSNIIPTGDEDQVHGAWQVHAALVRRSIERGIYQGWDLHPAQLPTRFAVTYRFFRKGLETVLDRLAAFLGAAGSAAPQFADEPATAQALAAFVLRGVGCGAVDASEVVERGLALTDLSALSARRFG